MRGLPPGYKTAAFALIVTLHRLELQGETIIKKKQLMDEAEESGLSVQGIYPRGDSGAANMAAGGRASLRAHTVPVYSKVAHSFPFQLNLTV